MQVPSTVCSNEARENNSQQAPTLGSKHADLKASLLHARQPSITYHQYTFRKSYSAPHTLKCNCTSPPLCLKAKSSALNLRPPWNCVHPLLSLRTMQPCPDDSIEWSLTAVSLTRPGDTAWRGVAVGGVGDTSPPPGPQKVTRHGLMDSAPFIQGAVEGWIKLDGG